MDARNHIIGWGIIIVGIMAALSGVTLYEAYSECSRVEKMIEASTSRITAATEARRQTGMELVRLLTPPVDPKSERIFGRK